MKGRAGSAFAFVILRDICGRRWPLQVPSFAASSKSDEQTLTVPAARITRDASHVIPVAA